jgi:hypothetical protein
MEKLIRRVDDYSIVLVSKEDVNKWAIEHAKRLGKKWHTKLDRFKSHEKLCRYTIFCDVIDILRIFKELQADKNCKFLFECKEYLQEVLTDKTTIEEINVAKVKLDPNDPLHVFIFKDKYDFRDKVNNLLQRRYIEPTLLTRHHYDTLIENFNEHYKGSIEVYVS